MCADNIKAPCLFTEHAGQSVLLTGFAKLKESIDEMSSAL